MHSDLIATVTPRLSLLSLATVTPRISTLSSELPNDRASETVELLNRAIREVVRRCCANPMWDLGNRFLICGKNTSKHLLVDY